MRGLCASRLRSGVVRLLVITPLYIPWVGGLENFVRQVVAELRTRGHEVVVVTSHQSADTVTDEVDGVTVLRVPAHHVTLTQDAAGILSAQMSIARLVNEFDPDLVHSHDAGPVLWLYTRAARRKRRPLVITLHNVMTQHLHGSVPVLAKLLREADAVTGVSQAVVDDTLAYEPSIAGRMTLIRNAIAPRLAEPSPLSVDPPRLACIGRLVPQKGFDVAIDAMAHLAPRHPGACLTIAGEGPEARALHTRATELGIADRVEFLGRVEPPDVAALLDRSTLVLMPSRFEGLPLVAIETAWAGRPLVATRAPGLSEALVDGVTGVMVEPEDARALARTVDDLLMDADRLRAMGRAARDSAESSYSFPACVDAYERLYEVRTARVVT